MENFLGTGRIAGLFPHMAKNKKNTKPGKMSIWGFFFLFFFVTNICELGPP